MITTKNGIQIQNFNTQIKKEKKEKKEKHIKLEQKDPTSIINTTYNLQIRYLFTNESIYLGFTILGFI